MPRWPAPLPLHYRPTRWTSTLMKTTPFCFHRSSGHARTSRTRFTGMRKANFASSVRLHVNSSIPETLAC
jgi:hypothetical protein